MRKFFLVTAHAGAYLVVGLILILSLGGFIHNLNWRFNWYSHPRPHFVLGSLFLLGWFAYQRHTWGIGLSLIALGINAAVLAPFFFSTNNVDHSGADLSILHLNTNQGAADMSPLTRYAADIIFLQEVTPELEANLPNQLPRYELAISHPLTNTQGIAMLVHKEAEIETELHTVHHMPWYNYRPLLTARLNLNGQRLQVMSLHTSRPHHDHADAFQLLELDAAADWSREQQAFGYDVIIVGDYNLTPWSARFKHFTETGQTVDSMLGFGIQNSWTAFVPMWLGLPIDHAVVSNDLVVLERETMPIEGSDHGALFVKVTTR